jgi:hypothetical protein
MAAPDSIKILVEEFERLKGGPAPDSFDEAQLCTSYVEPFWEALGWNVRDPREVVKEKRVHLRASTKHADYCFQLKGKPQFILEAKDFRKRLDDADFIFQTKRYGYNLPSDFGVLTNFGEFRLYDTGLKPVYDNKARGLFKPYHLQYTDYEEKWDELAAVFSRNAVAAGALRELLPKARRERNKEALDRTFFEGLNEWRAELARVIALRNPDVGVHDINEAVQRILDRCIFMRVIEDREIEAVELLLDALNRWSREKEKPLYRYMVDKFRYLEPQYNGELFEPHFSEDLLVDDKPLKDFIASLYYPQCPYQFNVVGVEMLGTIYERFLGSTIRLTPTHRAVVEEKPEVRKAGGVYYTPKYIVDYIVENTVGELLAACKTPAAAARLKILDPACGSGSFLLGAFQRLIDWHEDYFNANPDRISKGPAAECWRDEEAGRWRLGAKFKGRILVNNIFGVDVDEQACEVTRMSLYLKVLEDVNAQYLIKTALLPPLDANIKCGNSLIGSDYFEGQLMPSEEERRRVNPFDWEVEFPDIFKSGLKGGLDSGLKGGLDSGLKPTVSGGFDAVIGNPPYIRMEEFKSIKDYLKLEYKVHEERSDLYAYFLEKGVGLLNNSGKLGMIVSNKFIKSKYGKPLRGFLKRNLVLLKIADFAGLPVFYPATVRTVVLVGEKLKGRSRKQTLYLPPIPEEAFLIIRAGTGSVDELFADYGYIVEPANLGEDIWITERKKLTEFYGRLLRNFVPLRTYCDNKIWMGVKTGLKEAFVISGAKKEELVTGNNNCSTFIKPFVNGKSIRRYSLQDNNEYMIYTYHGVNISDCPEIVRHLEPYKKKLEGRATKQNWYELQQPQFRFSEYLDQPKIVYPDISTECRFALDVGGHYGDNTVYFIPKYDLYLLGLLNSKVLNFYFQIACAALEGPGDKYLRFFGQYLENAPIRIIDFGDPADVARHDKMVALVEEMLELHKRLAAAKSDADKQRLQRAIAATDRKIDTLVYELYGLTEEEIRIVES